MALLIFRISFLKSQAHPQTGSSQAMKGMRTRILRKMLRHLSFLPAAAGAEASPTAAPFNFLFANQGSIGHESGHAYIYRFTTSDGPLCSCELGIKADLHNV